MKLYYYIDAEGVLWPQSTIIEIDVTNNTDHISEKLIKHGFEYDKIRDDDSVNLRRYDIHDIMKDVCEYRKSNRPVKHNYFARFKSPTKMEPSFVFVDELICLSPEEALETALSYSINNPRWNHIRNNRVVAEISCGNNVVLTKEITISGHMSEWREHPEWAELDEDE